MPLRLAHEVVESYNRAEAERIYVGDLALARIKGVAIGVCAGFGLTVFAIVCLIARTL
jgi:hypothetical protein